MSICQSGIEGMAVGATILVEVNERHPLIQLARTLPWRELFELILPDLQKTKSGKWWLGRKLKVRVHLGVYLLQQLFNKKDREIEYDVKDNAAYQIFCGRGIVKKWHTPDHTKIEEFRSRLSPETQQKLANHLSVIATRLGFSKPTELDIDSTIQEANMAYPSDISLLTKVGAMTKKVWSYLTKKIPNFQLEPITIDLKEIKTKARSCFFNKSKEPDEKNHRLHDLWMSVFKQVSPVLKILDKILDEVDWKRMPWHIKRTAMQLKQHAHTYLVDVCVFLNRGTMVIGKRLSFHLEQVSCFNKGKIKGLQFGRAFQLGRIGGNFLIVGNNTSIRMEDKSSVQWVFATHKNLFGNIKNISAALDKGYYSKDNKVFIEKETGTSLGLQKPGEPLYLTVEEKTTATALANRRAGIEALIGHAKQGGQLGKSRMKSDRTIESSGYAAILGFNGRQLVRYLKGAAVPCK